MSNATTSTSAAFSAEQLSALDSMFAAFAAQVTQAITAAPTTPAAPAAPTAPAAPAAQPAFRSLTNTEYEALSPQQKAAYTLQCRAIVFGNKNDNLTGVYGYVTGFASNQVAKMQNSATHAVDTYSRTRSAYLMQRAGL